MTALNLQGRHINFNIDYFNINHLNIVGGQRGAKEKTHKLILIYSQHFKTVPGLRYAR